VAESVERIVRESWIRILTRFDAEDSHVASVLNPEIANVVLDRPQRIEELDQEATIASYELAECDFWSESNK
jgi:hypothetical protein